MLVCVLGNTRLRITQAFGAALEDNNLRAYYVEDAMAQRGNLQEVLLHETAVAWGRRWEEKTWSREPWK